MSHYHEYRFYSLTLDEYAARLMMADAEGREYFAIVPVPGSGKAWRERREEVLSAIEDAIAAGKPPGEIGL